MFWQFHQAPRQGEVYNAGGSRHSHCSMMEAIALCERIAGRKLKYEYIDDARSGDHIWYVSDVSKFKSHFPNWSYRYDLEAILVEIYEQWCVRTRKAA
jgi:CDP-paratose 2-epimerase